jgi:hypothetical protein
MSEEKEDLAKVLRAVIDQLEAETALLSEDPGGSVKASMLRLADMMQQGADTMRKLAEREDR